MFQLVVRDLNFGSASCMASSVKQCTSYFCTSVGDAPVLPRDAGSSPLPSACWSHSSGSEPPGRIIGKAPCLGVLDCRKDHSPLQRVRPRTFLSWGARDRASPPLCCQAPSATRASALTSAVHLAQLSINGCVWCVCLQSQHLGGRGRRTRSSRSSSPT